MVPKGKPQRRQSPVLTDPILQESADDDTHRPAAGHVELYWPTDSTPNLTNSPAHSSDPKPSQQEIWHIDGISMAPRIYRLIS